MKLPRDISGWELANKLAGLGYEITRQNGGHNLTVPRHEPLKVGTFSAILNDVAKHFSMNRDELIKLLF